MPSKPSVSRSRSLISDAEVETIPVLPHDVLGDKLEDRTYDLGSRRFASGGHLNLKVLPSGCVLLLSSLSEVPTEKISTEVYNIHSYSEKWRKNLLCRGTPFGPKVISSYTVGLDD